MRGEFCAAACNAPAGPHALPGTSVEQPSSCKFFNGDHVKIYFPVPSHSSDPIFWEPLPSALPSTREGPRHDGML